MQKLVGAWGKLVSGNAANGLLQLAIFAIAAQALELGALGVIILIQAYVRVVDGLLNFQSVNVLTNFLAGAQEAGDDVRVRGLIKAGLIVDFGTAFLATAIAIICLPIAAPILGLGGEWIALAAAYCAVIATRTFGAVEAALRCFDRFGAISFRPVVSSLAIFAGSLVAWVCGAGAHVFLLIWLVGEALANIGFLIWTLVYLRKDGLSDVHKSDARLAIANSPNFWSMMWQTNFTYGLRILSQEGDVLIIGAFLGEAAAALLRAAKNLAVLVGQFGKPLHQAASVPISRLVAGGEDAQAFRFALLASLGVAGISLIVIAIMVVATPTVLSFAFGEGFQGAYWLVIGLLAAKTLYLSGAALPPIMIAYDIAKQFTAMIALGTLVFFAVLLALIGPLGMIAAVFAHLAFEAVWALYGWAVTAHEARRRGGSRPI